MLRKRKVDSLF